MINFTKTKLIYILILIIFFTKRFWGINLPWFISPAICVVGIFLAFCNLRGKRIDNNVKINFFLTIIPLFFIILYSLFNWLFNSHVVLSTSIISNLFTSNFYIVLAVMFGSAFYLVLKEDAIKTAFVAAVVSYFIGSIVAIFFKYGIADSFKYLFTSSGDDNLVYVMEVHDLTFAFGNFFLYFAFFYKGDRQEKLKYLIISILMIWFGYKRIEIIALVICILCFYAFFTRRNLLFSLKILAFFIFLGSFLYIFFIHSSYLTDLALKYNIDFKGRLGTYTYIAKNYSSFSPAFAGLGYGTIDEIIVNLQNENLVIGWSTIISLHSDTFRMYIGLGFFGFAIWMIYMLFIRTKYTYNKIGINCAKIYILLTLYNFILYLTDNTYGYYLTIFTFTICVLSVKEEKRINECVRM